MTVAGVSDQPVNPLSKAQCVDNFIRALSSRDGDVPASIDKDRSSTITSASFFVLLAGVIFPGRPGKVVASNAQPKSVLSRPAVATFIVQQHLNNGWLIAVDHALCSLVRRIQKNRQQGYQRQQYQGRESESC